MRLRNKITMNVIRQKALLFSSDKKFIASIGWFHKFKQRNNLKI